MNTRTPYQSKSDTSRAAAESHDDAGINRLEGIVLYALHFAGSRGLTSQEIEEHTGLDGNTVRPRVWALRRRGLIRDSRNEDGTPATRPTTSGRAAVIHVASFPRPSRQQSAAMPEAVSVHGVGATR